MGPLHIEVMTSRLKSEFAVDVVLKAPKIAYRETVTRVKKEISSPLAVRRELVKRYGIEGSLYGAVKSADKVVKLLRG